MKRIKENFLKILNGKITLKGLSILEVGCGAGNYSRQISSKCASLVAIDPCSESVRSAEKANISNNTTYKVGIAESLDFEDQVFDMVIFTLSLHHVPFKKMPHAISEAVRVLKKNGNVVFLEPAEDGTFFDAEIVFDACDGDERKEKGLAKEAIKNSLLLDKLYEEEDETIFLFESADDFIKSLGPKKKLDEIEGFLEKNLMTLVAKRRIDICKIQKLI